MIHIFRESPSKKSKRILILFHGSGGDEHDLLPLCADIDPDAAILSLRGNVSENGMLRFFRRFSTGKFDQENIISEAGGIYRFLSDFIAMHDRVPSDLLFVGFSNGANMIVALLFLYPSLVRHALILHGLLPLDDAHIPAPAVDLSGSSLFVSLGLGDQMIAPAATLSLISVLRSHGAAVTIYKDDAGHTVTEGELDAARKFLEQHYRKFIE